MPTPPCGRRPARSGCPKIRCSSLYPAPPEGRFVTPAAPGSLEHAMEVADAAFLMGQIQALEARRAHPALQFLRLRFVLRQRNMRKTCLMTVADDVVKMRRAGRRALPRTHPHELLEIPQHPLRVARIGPMAEQPK